MGTYLTYFLEYKDRATNRWKNVFSLVQKPDYEYPENTTNITFGEYAYNGNGYTRESDKFLLLERTFCVANHNCIQGYIRDVFSAHGWYDEPFTGRGFPEDMSQELKCFIHHQELEAFEDDKQYIDPDKEWKLVDGVLREVPRTEPITFEKDFKDFKYDKTWATLSELSDFADRQTVKAEQAIKEYKDKDAFAKIDERLKRIENFIQSGKKEEVPEQPEQEDDVWYEEELDEMLENARFFSQWVYGLKLIVDFFNGGWNDYQDIRVIVYLS